jgi:hypothetical protein
MKTKHPDASHAQSRFSLSAGIARTPLDPADPASTCQVTLCFLTFPMARSSVSANTRKMPPRIPAPSHRHASPSGPWPWMDLDSDSDPDSELDPATPPTGDASKSAHTDIESGDCWVKYPQSLFRNWTPVQVERSGIKNIHVESDESCTCVVHSVDVKQDGRFSAPERQSVLEEGKGAYWKLMQERVSGKFAPTLLCCYLCGKLQASGRHSRSSLVRGESFSACIADAWNEVSLVRRDVDSKIQIQIQLQRRTVLLV